jgi:benzodiazapine receptor
MEFPMSKQIGTIVWVVLPFLAAWVGAQFPAKAYFAELIKPEWAPPAWLFAPVWTALFLCMGIAAALVWRKGGWASLPVRRALCLFVVQLLFNAMWSWIFFGSRLLGWAMVEIIVLWSLILATLLTFWRVQRAGGLLLVPYLLWVSFAAVLNFSIWRLNE